MLCWVAVNCLNRSAKWFKLHCFAYMRALFTAKRKTCTTVGNQQTHLCEVYAVYSWSGSFLGLDSWGVSTSGWGSGLVGLECANAQNSYCELLGGIRRRIPGVLYESWGVITPLRGCRKLSASIIKKNNKQLRIAKLTKQIFVKS